MKNINIEKKVLNRALVGRPRKPPPPMPRPLCLHPRARRQERLQPRQHVLHLRRRDLQLRLARARALRKDLQDQRCAVDDLDAAQRGLDVAPLRGRELVVDDTAHNRPRTSARWPPYSPVAA